MVLSLLPHSVCLSVPDFSCSSFSSIYLYLSVFLPPHPACHIMCPSFFFFPKKRQVDFTLPISSFTPLYSMYLSCSLTLFLFYSACHSFIFTPLSCSCILFLVYYACHYFIFPIYSLTPPVFLDYSLTLSCVAFLSIYSTFQRLFSLSVLILPIYSVCFSYTDCLLTLPECLAKSSYTPRIWAFLYRLLLYTLLVSLFHLLFLSLSENSLLSMPVLYLALFVFQHISLSLSLTLAAFISCLLFLSLLSLPSNSDFICGFSILSHSYSYKCMKCRLCTLILLCPQTVSEVWCRVPSLFSPPWPSTSVCVLYTVQ
jgi:hypothetical protein